LLSAAPTKEECELLAAPLFRNGMEEFIIPQDTRVPPSEAVSV